MAKGIYLIRHGQSTYNELFDSSGIDPVHFDAPLSRLGAKQVENARQAAKNLGAELVVTSPLTRALETAIGLFSAQSRGDNLRAGPESTNHGQSL